MVPLLTWSPLLFSWVRDIIIQVDTTLEVGEVVNQIGLEMSLPCEISLLKWHATVRHSTAARESWEMEGGIVSDMVRTLDYLLPGFEEKPLRLRCRLAWTEVEVLVDVRPDRG